MRTGDGGDGGDDTTGRVEGSKLIGEPGSGASAGAIWVDADSLNISPSARLEVGSGGDGGKITLSARNGVASEPGQSVLARGGRGGNSGEFHIDGFEGGTYGTGGAGSPMKIHVGNGGSGAAGGDCEIEMGMHGFGGKDRVRPPAAEWNSIELDGGFGGHSQTAGVSGGRAGSLVFRWTADTPCYRAVVIKDGFSGGNGFDGCAAEPKTAGTSGGAVPRVFDFPELSQKDVALEISGKSFVGGSGGDGLLSAGGPGHGAASGLDATDQKLGTDGTDGDPCQTAGGFQLIRPLGDDQHVELRALSNTGAVLILSRPTISSGTARLALVVDGVPTILNTPAEYGQVFPNAMNSSGLKVGLAVPATGPRFGFRWDTGGFARVFPDETSDTNATLLNEEGDYLGVKNLTSSGGQPVLFKGGTPIQIAPIGATYPTFMAMNNTGTLVGFHGDNPIRWRNGNYTTLNVPSNTFGGTVRAVNDNGLMAGFTFMGVNQHVPTVWDGTSPTALPLAGQPYGIAWTINIDGLVGGYQFTDSSTPSEALVWKNGAAQLVSNFMPNKTIQYRSVKFINSNGWVAGEGFDPAASRRVVFMWSERWNF